MNRLRTEKHLATISALVEGCRVRSTERMTGVHPRYGPALGGSHWASAINRRQTSLSKAYRQRPRPNLAS
jgi:hypothetical protein